MERHRSPACDVFISYAGLDRDVAAALAMELEAADVAMWWDAYLAADEPFEQQIQRILAETKAIITILSPQALASEWVRWELSQASQNGLHIVPLLVNGVGSEQLPPPLHLLPCLTLPVGDATAAMQRIATQIRELIETIKRRPARERENDARRRLASAAARTARQAADIKHRKARPAPPPTMTVHSSEHHGDEEESPAQYSMSDGLVSFLHNQNIAVGFTSFQTGQLFLLGRTTAGGLVVNVQRFRKPTGLFAHDGTLLVGTLAHLYRMENILRPGQCLDGIYSHCYVSRTGHFTGVLDAHDVGVTRSGEPVFVATRYNCLATISSVHSFKPIWRPAFISEVVAEDRCHLNGLAMRNGEPTYVTAVARSNVYDGWRDQVASGGIVVDVRSHATVCDGLSMPHSPRVHDDRLWVLNSGAGELGWVDVRGDSGCYRAIARCPGFVRGLAFHGRYALVGVSRPRYDDFAGLELDRRLRESGEDAWCGIQIIDITSGRCAHWFRIDGPVRELYDVAVLADVSCPRSVSNLDDEALDLVTIEDREQSGSARPPTLR